MIKNRMVFNEIDENLKNDSNKVIVLLWPRQVGKTTILKYFCDKLSQVWKKTLFLDLDIFENYEKVADYNSFLQYLVINWYDKNQSDFFYVFLDEFQRYKDFSLVLKNMYDNHKNIKIMVSWSCSLTIKNSLQESLAWRKRIINVYPLNFKEFLDFKWKNYLENWLKNIEKISWENLYTPLREYYKLLEEFLIWWWYPDVVLTNDSDQKQKVLSDIFDLFLKKEILEYLNIDKIKEIKEIMKYLAINNWQKIVYDEVAKISWLSVHLVKNYIEILKELFLTIELKPYFTNKNKELVKVPKIYFIDNWVRNYFLKNFNELDIRNDSWFLFEWYILSEYMKKGADGDGMKYWWDKNLHEVDLIIENWSKRDAIEIKFKKNIKSEDLSWLKHFVKDYPNFKLHIVNLDKKLTWDIDYVLPFNI